MSNNLCVGYMRFSSENQHESSIEYQQQAIYKYCAEHGLTLVEEYIDRAQSGTTTHRKEYQRMFSDACTKPEWSAIIVYDLSRFSRNMTDYSHHIQILAQAGIQVISVVEPYGQSPEGELIKNVKMSFNQYFSENNARVTHEAQKAQALKGKNCGGIAPLGYDFDDERKLIINDAEAELVRKIFQMYLSGTSYSLMAQTLNDEGYTTKAGRPFTKNSFCSLLRQEKYIGIYTWNKATPKFRSASGKLSKNGHKKKPIEQQIRIDGGCPAIISKKDFEAVQELLTSRSQGRATTKSKRLYVLGGLGLLKCGVCGRHMVGRPRHCRGKNYTVYCCPNHKGHTPLCPTKELPTDQIDKLVIKALVAHTFRKEDIPALSKLLRQHNPNIALIRRKQGVDRKISNILKSLELRPSEALANRLKSLEDEMADINAQISASPEAAFDLNNETFKEIRHELYKYLLSSKVPEARAFIKSTLKEVTITNEDITFTLNIE